MFFIFKIVRIRAVEWAYRYKQALIQLLDSSPVSVWVLIYAIMYFMIYSFAFCLHLNSLLARLLSAHIFFYCYCFDNSRHFTCQAVFVIFFSYWRLGLLLVSFFFLCSTFLFVSFHSSESILCVHSAGRLTVENWQGRVAYVCGCLTVCCVNVYARESVIAFSGFRFLIILNGCTFV